MLQASRKLDSVRCFVNSAAALQQQQQRSISIIPTVVRVAFSAARLPIFIAGTAVAGATVASNKFQGNVGESIQDIDIQIPEMNIKLSDLVSDVLASAKDKTQSINHIFNSKFPKREENQTTSDQTNQSAEPVVDTIKELHDLKQHIIEEEEEQEEIDEEALAKDAAMRMKHQDHQFILLCRKFASIRNTLMSIQHRVIPYIPSIVMIGSRHAHQLIIESILGQSFALTDAVYEKNKVLEFYFINSSDLKEPKIQINGEEALLSIAEAEKLVQKLASKEDQNTIQISIYGSDVPYLNLYDIPEDNRALCEKYIRHNPYTVIMAVYDTALPSSESITSKLCDKYDPLGRRTVGILVKGSNIIEQTAASSEEEKEEQEGEEISKLSILPASSVVGNYRPPLSLGYIDMTHETTDLEKEQRLLRHHLFGIIEQSMGRSIYNIVGSIKSELEETSYLFKVIYNDHEMTAASYVTDTMDELKRGFKQFASSLGKPQLRAEVRHLLEQNVLNICAEQYWSDAKILDLAKADVDDFYWLYKMDLASAAITKSGIGRITTQLVMHVIMNNMQHLVKMEPFQYHPQVQKQIVDFTGEMLRQKFLATSDQVENTIKPYKYEVEVTDEEWKDGVKRTIKLLEKELNMCEEMLWTLKKNIGRKRLRSAIKRVLDEEKVQPVEEETEEQQPHRILEKAKEALFLQDRAMIIKYRLAALKSRQCKSPENKQYCPEAFLNIIAEKLTYTAVMFIQVELLNDFFFNFPLDVIDDRIVHPMSMAQIDKFAKENPSVQKHLILQDRKMKLEDVMDMLNYLVKRHDINPPNKH
ncbi:hypothetical protein INT46_009887 [Mucor plumbeus]|uniref:GED domain-containing protein n=1 Tax=Mucor plumbeus TaxID=97098 RepID=A0A8H7RML0_9FUNG|nr:hypothetical protein INT46_009887 [Mucor plumbeus]